MPFMTWNDKLSVGIAVIDEDHKKLVAMINELYDGIREGHGREALGGIFDRLIDYTRYHFAREEKLFDETAYSGAKKHKKEHGDLIRVVLKAREEFQSSQVIAPSLEMMGVLKDWLFDHILGSDQKYAPYLKTMGIH
jgi:hemerythrin-like metal-binding protein